VVVDSSDCLVRAAPGRVAAVVGLDGVLVVDTPDAVLVCAKGRSQDVKKVVERLEATGRTDVL
jgi:mannose-1-phosphate guanylyltransferase